MMKNFLNRILKRQSPWTQPWLLPYKDIIKQGKKLKVGQGSRSKLYENAWTDEDYDKAVIHYIASSKWQQLPVKYCRAEINKRHVLMMDCDTEESMIGASLFLEKALNIKYEVVESSPGHYWIFANYWSKNPKDVLAYLSIIPCVDEQYVQYCNDNDALYVRITPRGKQKQTKAVLPSSIWHPIFNKEHCLEGYAKKFYEFLMGNYKMLEELIAVMYEIDYAYKTNNLSGTLANPEFLNARGIEKATSTPTKCSTTR